jgi:hypothetical protein
VVAWLKTGKKITAYLKQPVAVIGATSGVLHPATD